jgi:hypothetical protein
VEVQRHAALYEVSAAGLIKHLISLPFPVIAYSVPQVYFGFWILDFGLDKSVNKSITQNQSLYIQSQNKITLIIKPLILNEELHHLLHKITTMKIFVKLLTLFTASLDLTLQTGGFLIFRVNC